MLLIALEGGEGSGKSTQAKTLYQHLLKRGFPSLLVHEPGGTSLGRKLRQLLKSQAMSPETELFLFAAARSQLVREAINPALERRMVVITDRFSPSTLAYQGFGRRLDLGIVQSIDDLATGGRRPDLVVLLDLPSADGLRRKATPKDRFEEEEEAFHLRVRRGYLELARTDADHWLVVDARLPKKKIAQIIWDRVEKLLDEGGV